MILKVAQWIHTIEGIRIINLMIFNDCCRDWPEYVLISLGEFRIHGKKKYDWFHVPFFIAFNLLWNRANFIGIVSASGNVRLGPRVKSVKRKNPGHESKLKKLSNRKTKSLCHKSLWRHKLPKGWKQKPFNLAFWFRIHDHLQCASWLMCLKRVSLFSDWICLSGLWYKINIHIRYMTKNQWRKPPAFAHAGRARANMYTYVCVCVCGLWCRQSRFDSIFVVPIYTKITYSNTRRVYPLCALFSGERECDKQKALPSITLNTHAHWTAHFGL